MQTWLNLQNAYDVKVAEIVEQKELEEGSEKEICEMIDRQKIRAEHKIAGSVADALEKAVKEADENDIVLVCGSLYILGDAIRWLRKQESAE